MSDKIKVFTIGDHPLSPSGVGTQTRYIIEGLLKTGKYQFVSFGGAIKHPDHNPQKTEAWGEDWIIWPVDGYGSQDQVRAMIGQQRPDILCRILAFMSGFGLSKMKLDHKFQWCTIMSGTITLIQNLINLIMHQMIMWLVSQN